jgi:hypothetical protein
VKKLHKSAREEFGLVLRWIMPWWWQYLFYPVTSKYDKRLTLAILWCRVRGHPYGVAWYNHHGDEPDMSCNGCGENLG